MKRWMRHKRDQIRGHRLACGQAAIELSVLVTLLAPILVAATDFARVFYMSIELNNAARAGVQYGAQNPVTAANISAMEQAATNDAADITGMTVTASMYCECPGGSPFSCNSGTSCSDMRVYVQVNTSGTFKTLLQYPWVPYPITLSGQAIMREQ